MSINKIAFLLNTPDIYNHYHNIFRLLGRNKFDVLLMDDICEDQKLVSLLEQENIAFFSVNDVLQRGDRYRYLVSHQIVGYCNVEGYLPKRLADYNIRFLYGLGMGGWHYADWNEIYDLILCFGPHHVDRFGFCTRSIKLQMGYPRYDEFFSDHLNETEIRRELTCDASKQTVVWLPTYRALSSIPHYAQYVSKLSEQYNVIVKPHPGTVVSEPDTMIYLKDGEFTNIVKDMYDNTRLFKIADYVLADYGGSIFGAIYTDRNLLLLNVPDAEQDHELGITDSEDLAVRSLIYNINVEDGKGIRNILGFRPLWEEQAAVRNILRQRYFAPFYGFSSKVVVGILLNIDEISKLSYTNVGG